jgi:hypothetical protein
MTGRMHHPLDKITRITPIIRSQLPMLLGTYQAVMEGLRIN